MPRRWHPTTLNEQFETFGNTVSEYSFELTRDEVLTCGAMVTHHAGVRGPLKSGKWGHMFLFPDKSTRENELAQSVHRHRSSTVRRFVLRNPLKSKTLANGVQQLYVLSNVSKKSTKRHEAVKTRTASRKVLWAQSARRLHTPIRT